LWVNNSGIAVGDSEENTSHGFVDVPVMFAPNGIVDLGVKNASYGMAVCINNYGQVVGNLFFEDKHANATQAFLYQNGVMTPLGHPVKNIGFSAAAAINDSGLVVGYALFASGQNFHAACYTNGAWVDLGTIGSPNLFEAYATSVNDSGTIVGDWSNGAGSLVGCFIYQNGQMTDLHAPQNAFDESPFINNAGQIVLANFIYQNGVWQDINHLDLGDGWTFSQALGINNQGAIIGTVFREFNDGTFLYRDALLTPVSSNQQAATRTP
jgi:probable HAF family extracellular repeat protein